ncbi:Gfo/Idh/MocA family protein [Paenibacillus sp. YIM B09110]|uniref:Gfo/Idh/MocA family protein n=1 Tax=Paenibacillus sp. YIM B09110 TaxID=3126102 RepID=UPI00301BC007
MFKHRIVLVGHGSISRVYLKALEVQPNAMIAGVVGRDANRAELFALQHGIPVWGTDLAEVVVRSGATAAVICTPNAHHYEAVLAAAALSLHCLCEKPLHITLQGQREMIEGCKGSGVKLAVSYMRRFSRHWQLIKQVIEEGKLGRITAIDATIKHYRDPAYYDSWHGTYEWDGGGPFIQQGSHLIDLVQWLCGGYQEVTASRMYRILHDIETEDHGYAVVRYANGAVGMINVSTACVGMGRELIEISGTRGSVSADFNGIVAWEIAGCEPPLQAEMAMENEELFTLLVEDFLRSIEEDRPPFVEGKTAAITSELVHEIYLKAGAPIVTMR